MEKNGKNIIQFEPLNVRITISEQKLQFDNLFNNDPALGKVSNRIINDNLNLFTHDVIPELEKSLSKKFTEIANSILSTTTYDEMFPPSS